MRPLAIVLGAFGVVCQVGGVALMLLTCTAGSAVSELELARNPYGIWRAHGDVVHLEPGTTVAVDVWSDYTSSGRMQMDVVGTSVRGNTVRLSTSADDDEGGSTYRRFDRVGTFVATDEGPWTFDVSIASMGISVDRAEAVVREGAVDYEVPGLVVLLLGMLVAGLAGVFRRRGAPPPAEPEPASSSSDSDPPPPAPRGPPGIHVG